MYGRRVCLRQKADGELFILSIIASYIDDDNKHTTPLEWVLWSSGEELNLFIFQPSILVVMSILLMEKLNKWLHWSGNYIASTFGIIARFNCFSVQNSVHNTILAEFSTYLWRILCSSAFLTRKVKKKLQAVRSTIQLFCQKKQKIIESRILIRKVAEVS